jgi:hypothetical protein
MNRQHQTLFLRRATDLLLIADWPSPASSVRKPGATVPPGDITLRMRRVEDRRDYSSVLWLRAGFALPSVCLYRTRKTGNRQRGSGAHKETR